MISINISQEEPDAGESVMVENTPELQQENQSDQESADDNHVLTEEQPKQDPKPDDATDTHKTLHSGPEPRKPKLPPLTIVPPIRKTLITLNPAYLKSCPEKLHVTLKTET